MYRKRNGSIGVSFTRFMNNAAPNLAADPNRFASIPNLGQDMLYQHQLALSSRIPSAPYALEEGSFFVGGVCDNESVSRKVYAKLKDVGILDGSGCVDTKKLDGKKFVNQIAIIPVARQRMLVDLLFWWEEECVRLRKLVAEEEELTGLIGGLESQTGDDLGHGHEHGHDGHGDEMGSEHHEEERGRLLDGMKFEREKVRMRIRQRPSERRADVENGTDGLYVEAHGRGSVGGQDIDLSSAANVPTADPPAYRP